MSTDNEHTDIIQSQVAELMNILMAIFDSDEIDTFDMATLAQGLEGYVQQVEQIATTAEAGGLMGLYNICVLYQAALVPLIGNSDALSEQVLILLESWPSLVMSYLEAPDSPDISSALIEHLQEPAWLTPLEADEAEILKVMLAEPAPEALTAADDPPLEDALAFDHRFEEANGFELPPVETDVIDTHVSDKTFLSDDANDALLSEREEEGVTPDGSSGETEALMMPPEEEDASAWHVTENNELDATTKELISLLSFEVSQFAESLEALLLEDTVEDWRQLLTDHLEEVERLGDGADAAGLAGLQQACGHIATNVLNAATQEESLGDAQRQVIAGWPHVALAYLENPYDHSARTKLVLYLQDHRWLQPLSDDIRDTLVESLGVIEVDEAEQNQEPRKRHAELDDIALNLPEDVNPALLDSLLQELPRQAADFTDAIQRLTTTEGTLADVEIAQRVAHTLKGAANTVGVPGVANLTHHLEDILLALTQRQTLPNAFLNQALVNAADCLELMNETLAGVSAPPSPDEILNVLQEVLDWANLLDTIDTLEPDMRPESREFMPGMVEAQLPQQRATDPAQADAASGPTRISADLVDDLLRLAGEAMILNGQLRDRLMRTTQQMGAMQAQNQNLLQLVFELEHLVDIRGLTSPLLHHVAEDEFDPLEMEQYNELHTVSRRLLEAVTDTRELTQEAVSSLATLGDTLTTQQKVQQESEETIMRTRMVPVKTIAPRLQRGIRQACRLTGKEAELVVGGAETLIDGNVLNSMVDPLMHMLRNAVDHGLESPEQREQIGKSREGTIHLDFVREGNSILIRCRDDGAGLNYDAIRETALAQGLIREQQVLSQDELGRLILHPNFSTRSETTQVSGRGIGMDAVYTRIQELKGSLHLSSVTNQGCQIELRLPVTLMSTHALLVRAGREVFAVSDRGISQILYPGAGEVGQVSNKMTYQLGREIFEAKTLWDTLHLRSPQLDEQLAHCPALLIREESGRGLAVLVEEVVDSQT